MADTKLKPVCPHCGQNIRNNGRVLHLNYRTIALTTAEAKIVDYLKTHGRGSFKELYELNHARNGVGIDVWKSSVSGNAKRLRRKLRAADPSRFFIVNVFNYGYAWREPRV